MKMLTYVISVQKKCFKIIIFLLQGFDYIQSCLKISANRVACFKNIAMQLGLEVNTVAEKSIRYYYINMIIYIYYIKLNYFLSTENTALIRRDIIAIHPRVKHMNVIGKFLKIIEISLRNLIFLFYCRYCGGTRNAIFGYLWRRCEISLSVHY